MDRYFPVISKTSLRKGVEKQRVTRRQQPYPKPITQDEQRHDIMPDDNQVTEPSTSALTKYLLATLAEESNPITHSDIGERSGRVVSTSSGHQVIEDRRNRRSYLEDRKQKLTLQRDSESSSKEFQVLKNIRVYINGFLDCTTDIELKRIISRAGGEIVATPSGCTHILTSQPLSGSKTHKIITSKTQKSVRVVRPEWITDSIKAGKKKPERDYAVIKDTTMNKIYDMLRKEGMT